MTPRARAFVVVVGIIELVVTSVAVRDLRQRSSRAVRGPKWLWGLVCFIQPVGPILYLTIGRRTADS